jgi:hypothetical protein
MCSSIDSKRHAEKVKKWKVVWPPEGVTSLLNNSESCFVQLSGPLHKDEGNTSTVIGRWPGSQIVTGINRDCRERKRISFQPVVAGNGAAI